MVRYLENMVSGGGLPNQTPWHFVAPDMPHVDVPCGEELLSDCVKDISDEGLDLNVSVAYCRSLHWQFAVDWGVWSEFPFWCPTKCKTSLSVE